MTSIFRRHRLGFTLVGVWAAALVGYALPAGAAQPRQDADARPARLSFTEGTVSFWRTGADDWVRARLNTPLAPGDHVYASTGGKFEVQFGPEAFVRGDEESELALQTLEPDYVQFSVPKGVVAVDARSLDADTVVEIDTPGAAFTIRKAGYYRVDVGDATTEFVAHQGGEAEAVVEAGERWLVHAEEQVVIDPSSSPVLNTYQAPELDDWDRWNQERSAGMVAPKSKQYLPRGVYGGEVLDQYGSWDDEPNYGRVWYPREVEQDWAPYSAGQWVWDPGFGWTWIDDNPWGWAPSHYGRWVHVGPRWGWAPGPIVERPFYAPAVVGFLDAPSVRLSIGIGPIGWVALGWGEPIVPWWGHRGFVGEPCWRGWGGPRIVNTVVIREREVVRVDRIVYEHTHTPGALFGAPRDRFGEGGFRPTRLDSDRSSFRPVRGALSVRPSARSLVPFTSGQDRHVPAPARQIMDRPTVARQRPVDPMNRVQAQGLRAARREPAARVVVPQRVSPRVNEVSNPPPAPPRREPVTGRARRSVERGAEGGSAPQAPNGRIERPGRVNDPRLRGNGGENQNPANERRVAPPPPDARGGEPRDRQSPRERVNRGSERVAPPPPNQVPAPEQRGQGSGERVREPRPIRPERPLRSEPPPVPHSGSINQPEEPRRAEPHSRPARPEAAPERPQRLERPARSEPVPRAIPQAAPAPRPPEARPAEPARERVERRMPERVQPPEPRSAPPVREPRAMPVPERHVEPARAPREIPQPREQMRAPERHEQPMRAAPPPPQAPPRMAPPPQAAPRMAPPPQAAPRMAPAPREAPHHDPGQRRERPER